MKERKVSITEARHYLSAWGNENIIRNHLAYFEQKLKEEISNLKNEAIRSSLANYPNFAAWIRLYSELICNSLYWRLLRFEGDWARIENMNFRDAKRELFKIIDKIRASYPEKYEEHDIYGMKESFELILDLRHSFQHGGLPNLMRKLRYCKDPAKLDGILNPNNYEETKITFSDAEKLLKQLPQPAIKLQQ